MDFITFSWADYLLFGLMFGLSIAVGIYFGCFGKQQTTSDYLFGGKQMKVFPVSMSLVASTLSGITLLGLPAEIYMHGTQYSMMVLSLPIVGLIYNFIYLPVFYKLQLANAYEYFELRFDKRIKTVISVLYTIASFLWLPIFTYAPALAFNQVTGFDMYIIAPVMSLICIFYTTIGGLKAVVWTDTLQFSVTLCTLAFVLIMGTISAGGPAVIWEKAQRGDRLEFFNMNPDPTMRTTFWSVVIGNFFVWSTFLSTDPASIQRSLSVPTLRDARICSVIYVIFTIITKLIACFFGLIMYAKYYDCDPLSVGTIRKGDQILPFYVLEVAASIPGISGLFVAGLFSTALSTLSTVLNTLSGICYSGFVAPYMPANTTEKRASTLMKIITVVLGLGSLGLIFVIEKMGTILEIMISIHGLTAGPIMGLFTMGMLFPFANKKGALVGSVGALLFITGIVVKTQTHIWNGSLQYKPKPLETSGCNLTTTMQSALLNETQASTITISTDHLPEEPIWLFKLSFHYYVFIGALTTLIIGLPVSWITRCTAEPPVNPRLLSPFVRRLCVKSKLTIRRKSVEKELCVSDKAKEDQGDKDLVSDRLLQ